LTLLHGDLKVGIDMRVLMAGFIFLSLVFTSAAFAQDAEGEVESLGYGGVYRPNCWTPMKLRLRPKVGETRTYKIAIVQEDLDRDRVIYTRPFTLNGNPPGGARIEEQVWVYFMPQPRDLELPLGSANAAAYSNRIRIFLCRESDGKQLVQIPFTPTTQLPRSLDNRSDFFGRGRGARLVLLVGGSASRPVGQIYDRGVALTEDVDFYKITPAELPGDVKGFGCVDAIVWMGSSGPEELRADSLAAIQDYVRDGGKLVVTQGQNWQKFKESELAAMLPVTLEGERNEKGVASLRALAGMPNFEALDDVQRAQLRAPWIMKSTGNITIPNDPWSNLQGKDSPLIIASPREGAFINLYCQTDAPTPYLARWMFGLGTVTWVAQDFGDQQIIATGQDRAKGWQAIWDRTMDWRNDTLIGMMEKPPRLWDGGTSNRPDLSRTVLAGMELPRRGAALVALAMVLFIGYWLVAGPGSYFFLVSKRKAYYSWVAFALCAVGATALTAAVVKLVLRGPPQLQHVTFVRMNPQREAVAHSQFGLYIPRDGNQHVELTDIAPKRFSYLTPYPIHPEHLVESADFPAYKEYEVPMRDRNSAEPPAIDVPYRSTLKKFQARWIGTLSGGIDGKAKILDNGRLAGSLVNNTGHDLRYIHLIYTRNAEMPYQTNLRDDEMIELKDSFDGKGAWANGASLDLTDIFNKVGIAGPDSRSNNVGLRGPLNRVWMANWSEEIRSSLGPSDRYNNNDRAALLMTIFDRLKPGEFPRDGERQDRYDLLRRGGRAFDASGVVSAGQLLIFARADAPLPFGLKVEGEAVKGEGVVYYQINVPLERMGASTQPIRPNDAGIFDLGAAPPVDPPIQPATPTFRPPAQRQRR
jgi:hypothetical protein